MWGTLGCPVLNTKGARLLIFRIFSEFLPQCYVENKKC